MGKTLMPDITLYHASPSRSSVVLWMLEEVGVPYDIKLLSLSKGDNLKPDYLAINPMGKVPAIKHGDTIITEVAAICTYLADAFPDKNLAVPIGTPRRGAYLKWLFFGPGCLEPAVTDRAAPRRDPPRRSMLGYGEFDTTMDVIAKAVEKGPWLMGEQFTAADVVIGANIRWGTIFKLIPERKEFVDYAARIAARPAVQRAEAKDKEMATPPAA
jgi:glutathione S-transferase